jgi:hypothetical protein
MLDVALLTELLIFAPFPLYKHFVPTGRRWRHLD